MSVFSSALNNLQVQSGAPVMLVFNETARELPYDLARGRTVSELIEENASFLGLTDVSRITNYVVNGEVQPAHTTVRPGDQVRVAVNCESKG
jgi:sulfur carrier protein ThiS